MQIVEDRDLVDKRHREAREIPAHVRLQLGRQPRDEIAIGAVNEPVLVAQRGGVRGAHADIAIGTDHRMRRREHLSRRSRHAAVEVLHRGHAARNHLERGIERIEIEIHIAKPEPAGEPQLERMVGRAELERRQSDMVVGVDQSGDHNTAGAADEASVRVHPPQLRERAQHLCSALGDRDCGVGVQQRLVVGQKSFEDVAAVNQA